MIQTVTDMQLAPHLGVSIAAITELEGVLGVSAKSRQPHLKRARKQIKKARKAFDTWAPIEISLVDWFALLACDCDKLAHLQQCAMSHEALANPNAADSTRRELADQLHRLRTRSKQLLYCLEFTHPILSADGRRLIKSLTSLEQQLGQHHDYTVLMATLARKLSSRETEWQLRKYIDSLRVRLETEMANAKATHGQLSAVKLAPRSRPKHNPRTRHRR
jgi:CHAD domain-containing protein